MTPASKNPSPGWRGKDFKRPPKKYAPKGLTILYEDRDILVVNKINGLLTISSAGEKENTAHFILNDYVRKGNPKSRNRVFIVHRLDQDTSGILVFAKSDKAKFYLQHEWSNFDKTYVAVVHGKLKDQEGVISSYLLESKAYKVFSTNDTTQGKLAETGYRVIKEGEHFSLLEIQLFTGRKHQIRVHLAELGHPVAGDKLYGKGKMGIKRLALHATTLTLSHPHSKEQMMFEAPIPNYFKVIMKG
ncbi:MAG TPA: RluA family pseudouridine synthase [Cyclobacteriaceae bacterium]|nr:RluA family pseudouridine synthase [Cyclobacteriaceae bacterium]